MISDLTDKLPLMQINRIEAGLIEDAIMEFNLIGSVWFPKEVTKGQSIEKIVSASADSL
ncbi:hypothetical protein GF359_06595 [candidate division WOR-3 bacterium]|uniref:Uncharacterized protein n=1 Tax=candidate division WOR-3 bacterium TaxID=2052148 RepID=A0A9D5K9G8_UNCW3|nr:hypothetical protein [candidate division WOR-3 bacterium]MBD3364867.1 hypothetical protein [candidate division WOR-3 bacterium]